MQLHEILCAVQLTDEERKVIGYKAVSDMIKRDIEEKKRAKSD